MILCATNEKSDKGNLGQKGLSDNTKVNFGAKKDHGSQLVSSVEMSEMQRNVPPQRPC